MVKPLKVRRGKKLQSFQRIRNFQQAQAVKISERETEASDAGEGQLRWRTTRDAASHV